MELYLQFGYGMMGHTKELLTRWGDAGVILSPRDLTPEQLAKVAESAVQLRSRVLLDPQCYIREADHQRLVAHEYWKANQDYTSSGFLDGTGAAELVQAVTTLNGQLGISQHILPGLLARDVDGDWLTLQARFAEEAQRYLSGEQVLSTIALSSEVMRDEAKVEAVVDAAEHWEVDGFYVVAETPSAYLVEDPIWLSNLLILASGLKLLGRSVVVGYTNHQGLSLASANVDAVASGTWLNVRAFPPDKFFLSADDEVSRRAKGGWYYCPQSLSEYKMPFLDVARKAACLDALQPIPPVPRDYSDPLFAGGVPSSVNWGETNAFRHYLDCLRAQVLGASKPSFDDTVSAHLRLLDGAAALLRGLREKGVRGQDRDFVDYVDVNRAAIALLQAARGSRLRREW